MNRDKDRHAFAALLVDGDSVLFKDELVKQGLEGGKKTASLLKLAIEENLSLQPPTHHLQVVIRVYANVRGLSKTYKDAGILDNASLLGNFERGVNMGYPLCDYVNAGDGKKCSDEKVKAMFKLYFDDVHCRHIFFGGSADNRYARLLEPYLQSETDRSRITLVEGSPFAPNWHASRIAFARCPSQKYLEVRKSSLSEARRHRLRCRPLPARATPLPRPSLPHANRPRRRLVHPRPAKKKA